MRIIRNADGKAMKHMKQAKKTEMGAIKQMWRKENENLKWITNQG